MSNRMPHSATIIGKFSPPLLKHCDTQIGRSIEDGSCLYIHEGIKTKDVTLSWQKPP